MFPFDFSLAGVSFAGIFVSALPYLFGFLIVAFIVVGAILDYHWRTYGVGIIRLFQFRLFYLAAGLVLLAVMFMSYASL